MHGFRGRSDIFENRKVPNPNHAYSPIKNISEKVNSDNKERELNKIDLTWKYPEHRIKWYEKYYAKKARLDKD